MATAIAAQLQETLYGMTRVRTDGNLTPGRRKHVEYEAPMVERKVELHTSRWTMLFYLSALAMLSDWLCFSAAPIAALVQRNLMLHDSHLVTCFLATNVVACLLEPAFVRNYGLRRAVVWGAAVMSLGCFLRMSASELALWGDNNNDDDDDRSSFEEAVRASRAPAWIAVAGTMFVGAAQPLFQCTPSLLAANWFGENETTFAVTMALNANQLGIAGSYAVGAGLVHSDDAMLHYFRALFAVSFVLAVGARIHFRERPPRPPSYSALASLRRAKKDSERKSLVEQFKHSKAAIEHAMGSRMPGYDYVNDDDDDDDDDYLNDGNDLSDDASSLSKSSSSGDRKEEDFVHEGIVDELRTVEVQPCCRSNDDDNNDNVNVVSEEQGGHRSSRRRRRSWSPRALLARRRHRRGAGLLRRWLVISRRVGHGALDVTRDLYSSTARLTRLPGFVTCLVAFIASIVASNIFSTFLPHLIATAKLRTKERNATTNARVATLGAFFQFFIMVGSLGFGFVVDSTKRYKAAMHCAFLGSVVALLAVSDARVVGYDLDAAVLLLGFFVGPVQPLAAELAVETTYPDADENHIVAIQQTFGNCASAVAVPAFHAISVFANDRHVAKRYNCRLDYYVLALAVLAAALFFRFSRGYRAPLKRVAANALSGPPPQGADDDPGRSSRTKYSTL